MIEIRKYLIRSAGGKAQTSTKEITLSPNWIRKHRIEAGDTVSVIASEVLVIIPPGLSKEKEDRIFDFMRNEEERNE